MKTRARRSACDSPVNASLRRMNGGIGGAEHGIKGGVGGYDENTKRRRQVVASRGWRYNTLDSGRNDGGRGIGRGALVMMRVM